MSDETKRPCPRCTIGLEAAGYSRKLKRHQDTGECRRVLAQQVRETVLAVRGFCPGVGLYRGSSVLDYLDAALPVSDRSENSPSGGLEVWVKRWVAAVYDAVRQGVRVIPETYSLRHSALASVQYIVHKGLQEEVLHLHELGGPTAVRAWLDAQGPLRVVEEPRR